jgi:DNA primase
LCPIPSHAHSGTGNPSFSVDLARGLFHCFSRDEGGDVFRFYELMHGVSFSRAVSELAAQLGIESNAAQPEHLPLRLRSAPDADETNSDAEPLDPSRTADICTEFVRLCAREDQSEGYGYLKRRGIGDAVIKVRPRRLFSAPRIQPRDALNDNRV